MNDGPSIEDYSRQVLRAARVARNEMAIARIRDRKPRSKLALAFLLEHSRRIQAQLPNSAKPSY